MRFRTRLIRIAAAAALAMMTMTCGIREDELRCEEAAAHLNQCCPGFDVHGIDCYYSEGCGTIYPAITISESRCILAADCATLVSTGVCKRAQGAQPQTASEVCP